MKKDEIGYEKASKKTVLVAAYYPVGPGRRGGGGISSFPGKKT
jgi:hypothetical protein